MIKTIENKYLTAEINETGAELYSIKSKKTGREYIWQGDPAYWSGRSPVLFPICGRLFQGKYTYCGKEYEMPIHGITKGVDFKSQKISENSVEFTLVSDENTKKQYPFEFEFTVRFALKKNSLLITYFVKNKDGKEMPFSFGAHPAFNVPFYDGGKFEDCFIEFSKNELDKVILSDSGLNLNKTEKFSLKDKKLYLKHDLFDNDAWFFAIKKGKTKLKSDKTPDFIEVSYNDMTCLGLWHMPKTDAPYVCIEPWHGIPCDEGKVDDFNNKRQTLRLSPNKTFKNTYSIKIKEF